MTRAILKTILAAGVAALLGAGAALAQTPPQPRVPESRAELQASFAPLVRKTAPAVVNIYASKMVKTRRGPTLFDDPFFRRFFGEVLPPGFDRPREQAQNSLGSGVILRPEGLIVTNAHVIEGADQIVVILADRRQFPAQVIGSDERTDLAILRVESGAPLPHLELGDSDALEVGDIVLAIGNPFGVGQTVTSGIVSALARTNVGISDLNSFIQTDAAINPGNSGGALVAMDGRVVGINTAIFSRSGGSHGIGFAIPSTMVRAVIAGFAKGDGRLVRPWLGAVTRAVAADDAASLKLARPIGALVESVHPKSPAAKAGVRPGDVILAVNGRDVDDDSSLRYRIATLAVGDAATLKLWRKGASVEVRAPLEAPVEDPPRDLTPLAGAHPLAGAVVANMSPALAEELGTERIQPGVYILQIRGGSPAARFGFRPGDSLRELNARKVGTVRELVAALERPAERWTIALERGGQKISVVVGR